MSGTLEMLNTANTKTDIFIKIAAAAINLNKFIEINL